MKNKYKINLHAHTYFSDGRNSPYRMALTAKKLGFTALVITDHFYSGNTSEWCSINIEKMKLLKRAAEEAKEIIPVIIGIEYVIEGEEILVFGSAMVNRIMIAEESGFEVTVEALLDWKKQVEAAFILCHPGNEDNWQKLLPILDGFEEYNRGISGFDDRGFGCLSELQRWCNSDAHRYEDLIIGWNLVDSKITVESDLIRYIKRKQQPEFRVYGDLIK